MTANAKVHSGASEIFHLVRHLHYVSFKRIGDAVDKRKRILRQRFFIAVVTKRDALFRLLLRCQLDRIDKSMDLHRIFISVVRVFLFGQTCHIRENIRSLPIPDIRVALPQILGAIRTLDGVKLCAERIDGYL